MRREVRRYEKILKGWRQREARLRGSETQGHLSAITKHFADALEAAIKTAAPLVKKHQEALVEADRLRMEAEAAKEDGGT